ncbi:TPA: hypothetical protein HA297_06710 [Candidatus Woesearchaeota archaeon]|nr:hypothetical protein [Candidatus Woesearchaeota archaeon]
MTFHDLRQFRNHSVSNDLPASPFNIAVQTVLILFQNMSKPRQRCAVHTAVKQVSEEFRMQ